MKKWIICVLLLLPGCHPDKPAYTPVNWDAPTIPPQSKPFPPAPPPEQPQTVNSQLLDLHNHERTTKGRPALQMDDQLNKYAQDHANWMAQHSNLQHSNISNVLKLGYMTAGENIAWNQQTPQEVVNAWMHSSGHRANILNNRFTKVGFGMAYNQHGEPYWCTVFGG
jgi:uncharacterized protein YkwD